MDAEGSQVLAFRISVVRRYVASKSARIFRWSAGSVRLSGLSRRLTPKQRSIPVVDRLGRLNERAPVVELCELAVQIQVGIVLEDDCDATSGLRL